MSSDVPEFTTENDELTAETMPSTSTPEISPATIATVASTPPTWAATNAGVLGAKPVAYFSAEFGIHESVPIYSGGLGVLAGDHIYKMDYQRMVEVHQENGADLTIGALRVRARSGGTVEPRRNAVRPTACTVESRVAD